MACPAFLHAQQLTVSATVTGSNGPWANGTAHASLVCPGNEQAYSGPTPIARDTPTVGLDSNGHFSQVLFDTSQLKNVNGNALTTCHYVFRITESCGIANFSTGPLTGITGAGPVDLTAQINTFTVPLSPACAAPAGTVTGTGVADEITLWTGPTSIGGTPNLTRDHTSGRINQTIPTNADAFYAGNVANDANFQVIYGANGTTPGNLGWSIQQTDDNYTTEAALVTFAGGKIQMQSLTMQASTPDIQHVSVNPDGTVDIKSYTAHDLIFPTASGTANQVIITDGANPQHMSWSTVNASLLAPQYSKLRCDTGLGDGLNAVAAGTYLQTNCYNDSGVTWTITRIGCFTDNAGSSTLNATNGAATGLLTGAVTCTAAAGGAAGTQSATTTIASGDVIKFTWVADGTSKQTSWFVSLTQ
jgi:hypothetical protein